MATRIFLGEPSANIKQWIINHSGPSTTATIITYTDGHTEQKNIIGEFTWQSLGNKTDMTTSVVSNITDIRIGTGVTSIGVWTFANYESLENVYIPDSVTSVSPYAFGYCDSLKTVTVSGQPTIGGAFQYCPSLKTMTFETGTVNYVRNNIVMFNECGSDRIKVVCSDTTAYVFNTNVGYMIPDNSQLTEVTYVDDTSDVLFDYDAGEELPTIDSPTLVKSVSIGSKVSYVGTMFANSTNLQDVEIKNGGYIYRIDANAFSNCPNLRTVSVNTGIGEINADAFKNCGNLESVVVAGAIGQIGSGVFQGCGNLTKFQCEGMDGQVGANAFANCISLETIDLKDAYPIGDDAFLGTINLAEITLNGVYIDDMKWYAKDWGIGLPGGQIVICHCKDGIVVINDNNDSSSY